MNNKTMKIVLTVAALVVVGVACWLMFGNKGGQRTDPTTVTTTAKATEQPATPATITTKATEQPATHATTTTKDAGASAEASTEATITAPATEEATEAVIGHITISVQDTDGKKLAEKVLGFQEGQTIGELLEANFENVTFDNGMLMTIESLTTPADYHTYIAFYINGEYAMQGVMTQPFKDGDKIDFIDTVYIPMDNTETTEESEAIIGTITITVQDKEQNVLAEKQIGFKEGQTIGELLEANFENVTFDNGMLITIESLTTPADYHTYIAFYINGEYAMEGVMTQPFKDGDKIDFIDTVYIP